MRLAALLLVAAFLAGRAAALDTPLVVIANRTSGVEALSREDVINIFMGRYSKLPSGLTALPVDDRKENAGFYRLLVDKGLPEIRSYWARLVFSGRASPPRQVQGAQEVLEIVANNKGALGYVGRAEVTDDVRVVFDLSP